MQKPKNKSIHNYKVFNKKFLKITSLMAAIIKVFEFPPKLSKKKKNTCYINNSSNLIFKFNMK